MITQMVFKREPARFDMCGQFIGYDLTVTNGTIKEGLINRLVKYASERMTNAGFPLTEKIEVETTDDDGIYSVSFENPSGGVISVVGIMTNRGGWPSLDHGFDIEVRQ